VIQNHVIAVEEAAIGAKNVQESGMTVAEQQQLDSVIEEVVRITLHFSFIYLILIFTYSLPTTTSTSIFTRSYNRWIQRL
jgi:hypothetical protein